MVAEICRVNVRGVREARTGEDSLVDVHADFSKLECRVSDHGQSSHRGDGSVDLVVRRQVVAEGEVGGSSSVHGVQRGCSSESDEDFPGREDVVTLDLDSRVGESLCNEVSAVHVVREERGRTPSLHATDVSRSDEDGRVEHDTRESENTPGAEQSEAVAEEDDGPPERSCCSLNLQTSSVS